MAKSLMMIVFAGLFTTTAHGAQVSGSWDKKEMDPRVGTRDAEVERILKIENISLVPGDTAVPLNLQCDQSSRCTFDFHYFKGVTFDLDNPSKNSILFIAGGPGQFVQENKAGNVALGALDGDGRQIVDGKVVPEVNGKQNIVYFHVRGAGQSLIDRSNEFDPLLRAKYVVEDIEKLRREVLGNKPWDGIYAHSWGTVVAQLYAKKYGRSDSAGGRPNGGVKSLILSAPIVRKSSDTLDARIRQTVSNLKQIFEFYRPTGDCTISDESYLKDRVTDFDENFNPGISGEDLDGTDNLCFVTDSRILAIVREVEKVLRDIEPDYGSLDFIQERENFDRLQRDPNFPPSLKKYPRELYAALRRIQLLGAPASDGLVFTQDTKSMIDMALIIGYHTTPEISRQLKTRCDTRGRFLTGAAAIPEIKAKYCSRLVRARTQLLESGDGLESKRARYAFGVYDGVARWIFRVLNKNCFSGQDLENFANAASGPTDRKKLLRNTAKKIGTDESGIPVCGWDPGGDNAHSVPTLIVAGSADAVIAGCQAEDFYNDGLTGQKVFLEFVGMGHAMSVANMRFGAMPSAQTQTFADLIEQFVKIAPTQLANFIASVQPKLSALKARERQPENNLIACRR